jgi:hypothetical protein
MTLRDAMGLVLRFAVLWTSVADLAPGQEGALPALRLRIGRGYWELGPFPVKRVT